MVFLGCHRVSSGPAGVGIWMLYVERIYYISVFADAAVRSVIQQSTIVRNGMYVKGQLLVPGIVDSSGRRGARQCVGNKGLARGAGIRALV